MGLGGQRHTAAALSLGKRPGTHCTEGWGARVPDLYHSKFLLVGFNQTASNVSTDG
jgi:hypothetical protein